MWWIPKGSAMRNQRNNIQTCLFFFSLCSSDSFHRKLLFRNNRLLDRALPKEVMKKTLSDCSPAILGITSKGVALIHTKCHLDYEQEGKK